MENSNFLKTKRNIDIVFCIDGTGSMSPCIENVKKNARRFYADFSSKITEMGSDIDLLRIKLIVFRDYKSDGDRSMIQSPFFEFPQEEGEFSEFLSNIKATGGCDEDANGLEALYYAMNSDFVTDIKDRQVIVLFADTSAIPLGKRKSCQNYPADMVDADGLLETWMCTQSHTTKLREKNKRLVIFAPYNSNYEEIFKSYNRSIFQPVEIHGGLDEVSFEKIMTIIAASATND